MACNCGGSRAAVHPQTQTPPPQISLPKTAGLPVAFVYVGSTALTAVGSFTRHAYRFVHAGAVLDVDSRDAPGMAGIPMLRRFRGASPVPER